MELNPLSGVIFRKVLMTPHHCPRMPPTDQDLLAEVPRLATKMPDQQPSGNHLELSKQYPEITRRAL
jgi:hypothetical protein